MDAAMLDEVRRWLGETGFDEELVAEDDGLLAPSTGRRFDPSELVVAASYRLGSAPDPDGSMIFALATPAGNPAGTYTARAGVEASEADTAILEQLRLRPVSSSVECPHSDHGHVAAVFADRTAAEGAVAELAEHGLGSDHLGVAVHGPAHTAFERDEEAAMARDAEEGIAAGAALGLLAGMSLTALAIPGLGVLGLGGLFAIGAASGFGGAMLGGLLGIAAADRARDSHEQLRSTPLGKGEVLVAVMCHDAPDEIAAVMRRHGGKVLPALDGVPPQAS